jgi:diacylglycerol kinase (ATP)
MSKRGSKSQPAGGVDQLLIISRGAGSITQEVEDRLRAAFADFHVIDFDPSTDFRRLLNPGARVVAAGGDGTIGFVSRALVETDHHLGVLSLGTYNNFARALGMPESLDQAIKVVRGGQARPVTLGRVNGKPFLEAAAIGLFGEAIALGEAAKDRHFGDMRLAFGKVTRAKPFQYRLSGDIEGHGSALSLVFANTPSMGARMPVGDGTPEDAHLELSVHVGESRTDILGRILSSAIAGRHGEEHLGMSFHFRNLRITTTPRVSVFADNMAAGRTPVTITAEVGALKVILPARRGPVRAAKP